jgi:hypothetical protein
MDAPMWPALDLQRAYAYRDRDAIATVLADLDADQLDRAVPVLITSYSDDVRGLAHLLDAPVAARALLREIDQVAAYAPAGCRTPPCSSPRWYAGAAAGPR